MHHRNRTTMELLYKNTLDHNEVLLVDKFDDTDREKSNRNKELEHTTTKSTMEYNERKYVEDLFELNSDEKQEYVVRMMSTTLNTLRHTKYQNL